MKYRSRSHNTSVPERYLDRRCRWPRIQLPTEEGEWSSKLAYAVGLLATDGGLVGGKTVVLVSKDQEQIATYRACIGAEAPIRFNKGAYRIQVCDVRFYRWLESLGITPRKSLTLGEIAVPHLFFFDLVRGLLDGDGSVLIHLVRPNPRAYPEHTYERLRVQFYSASRKHAVWLQSQLADRLGLVGWIGERIRPPRSPLYTLRYSKHDSVALLERLYADPLAPRLSRKWERWNEFRLHGRATRIWTNRRSDETGRHSGLKHP